MNAVVPPVLEGLYAWAEKVEYSAVGTAIAESRYLFVMIEGLHLLSLAVAFGLLLLVDLRLLDAALGGVPVARVLSQLRPWIIGAFMLVFVSGGLLFWSSAARMVANPAFGIKLVLIALAAINALYFELAVGRGMAKYADKSVTPRAVRFAGVASITLWSLVIVSGRLIPYLPSWIEGAIP
ncbi:MAG TPA: DUF6644 family protein [Steroidobacteraceae bacterium]|nr:DUF6644 family protein [Steroidobacteraceae bacterium]